MGDGNPHVAFFARHLPEIVTKSRRQVKPAPQGPGGLPEQGVPRGVDVGFRRLVHHLVVLGDVGLFPESVGPRKPGEGGVPLAGRDSELLAEETVLVFGEGCAPVVQGIVGAVVGGYIFSTFGISAGGGILGAIITGTVGAVLLLFIIGLIKRA